MKKVLAALAMMLSVVASAQTYTNEYPKELTLMALLRG